MNRNQKQQAEDRRFRADLDAARAGDREALAALLGRLEISSAQWSLERQGAGLQGKVNRSDVVQNVYLLILQGLPSFGGKTVPEFVKWAFSILDNNLRKQQRFFLADKRREPASPQEREEFVQALNKAHATPSAVVARTEDLLLADQAMNALPEDYRQVILLCAVDGRPHKEVGEIMGRGEGAVRMLLARARVALSKEIDKLEQN